MLKLTVMKLLLFTGAALLLLATASCGGGRGDAVRYNNKIVDEQSKIIKLILRLRDVTPGGKEALRQQVVVQSRASAAVVRKMDGFRGDNGLRDAAVRMFDKYASAFENEYKRMMELEAKATTGEVTEAEKTEYDEIAQKFNDMEKDYEEPFLEAQKKFARKNNMRISDSKLQKEIDKVN